MLVISDPAAIDTHWMADTDAPIRGLRLWGADSAAALAAIQPELADATIETSASRPTTFHITGSDWSPTRYKQLDRLLHHLIARQDWRVVTAFVRDSTIARIRGLVNTPERGGALPFPESPAPSDGFLVGFSPGFGDGSYRVLATLTDFGAEGGERVTQVTIDLMDPGYRF
jgi:hypothetical protein